MMRLILIIGLLAALPTHAGDFLRGADVSSLPQVEAGGAVFHQDGVPTDPVIILADHGVDTIRLRVWHTPQGGHCGRAATLQMARRAHDAGLGILLDFHYSDTWADPGQQLTPAAWVGLDVATLADSVRIHTREVLAALRDQGTPPVMVQLGNEITPGMLWDTGRVGGGYDTPQQWDNLAALLLAGIAGVDEAFPGRLAPEIMIHLDQGGNNGTCRWFFDKILERGVEFDAIGLSYYPWWHGNLADLENNLSDLATRYGKDLVLVETAYPWTLGWFDGTHNLVGLPEHLLPGFADSPAGQTLFLERLMEMMAAVPEGRGRGVFWWAPEWIAAPGFGSPWENLALFDDQGEALPALDAFQALSSVPPGPPDVPTSIGGFKSLFR